MSGSSTTEELHAAFWAERDAHAQKVAEALDAVQQAVNDGVDGGLYRDGITPALAEVQTMIAHLRNRLVPPATPTAPTN